MTTTEKTNLDRRVNEKQDEEALRRANESAPSKPQVYIIVTADHVPGLELAVNQKLTDGYTCLGGVAGRWEHPIRLFQAMILTEK
jgi:hypothetical protein